jgi:uncharacterized protein YndB with AHSA1/START domain
MPDTMPADPGQADAVPTEGRPTEGGPTEGGPASGPVTINDSGPMIVATLLLPACEPGTALAAFTDPAVLARWWRGELTVDLVAGGQYTVSFPKIPARMAGHVVSYVPGRSLEFSWAWDGEDEPPSTVTVRAEPADSGGSTVLTVVHGPHGEDEAGRKAHALHWEGWEYFLPGLPAALTG